MNKVFQKQNLNSFLIFKIIHIGFYEILLVIFLISVVEFFECNWQWEVSSRALCNPGE